MHVFLFGLGAVNWGISRISRVCVCYFSF